MKVSQTAGKLYIDNSFSTRPLEAKKSITNLLPPLQQALEGKTQDRNNEAKADGPGVGGNVNFYG